MAKAHLMAGGALDPIVDLDNVTYASALLPNCRAVLAPDAGHFLHNELPSLLRVYEQFFSGEEPQLEEA